LTNPIAKISNRNLDSDEGDIYAPIHVEDLDTGDHDPFHEEDVQPHRWLITTCIAGVAGSMVIGASVLGLFSETGSSSAQASVGLTERWQKPTVAAKSDLNGAVAKTLIPRPMYAALAAYQPDPGSGEGRTTTILPQSNGAPVGVFGGTGTVILPSQSILIDNFQLTAVSTPANTTTILKKLPPEPVDEVVVLQKGESLISRLIGLGVASNTAEQLAKALEPVFPAKLLKPGQKFLVTLDKQQDFFGNFVIFPVELSFSPGPSEEISIESNEEGKFFVRVNGQQKRQPSRYAAPRSGQFRIAGRVTSSLYATALDKGVPKYIINQVIRAFSHDVDFQRDVGLGTRFEIYFGKPFSGSSKKRMVVHYAAVEVRGKMKKLYRFTNARGRTAYYDEKGGGAKKYFLRTLVRGARISSGFGMRVHPVLGYSKMHTGIDFAAPRGTPIRASADGKIVYRARKGAYGYTIEIKHSNGYLTRYAHQSGFARGLRVGSRVRQGQVIGYVGKSGRVTGNHLHYEVRINNKAVNPSRLRVASTGRLGGKGLARFKQRRQKIIALMNKQPIAQRLASIAN